MLIKITNTTFVKWLSIEMFMTSLTQLIDNLEVKFFKLYQKNTQLQKHNSDLLIELRQKKDELKAKSNEITSLKNELQQLKTANALLGSNENKRETKLKINSLIREIDYCIVQLSHKDE